MKDFSLIVKVFGWLCVLAILCLFCVFGSLIGGCNTASQMANKTIFNADKNVWTFEKFVDCKENWERYDMLVAEAEQKLEELEIRAGKYGRYDPQERANLVMERDGSRQMRKEVAQQYNKMSGIWYKNIWKSKGLPERLEY